MYIYTSVMHVYAYYKTNILEIKLFMIQVNLFNYSKNKILTIIN